jgi:predicted nucleotidyltransferase component of viral defense system
MRPMLHPFTDKLDATVRTVSLEELAVERLVGLAGRPRARDVYDLWFIFKYGREQFDASRIRALVEQLAPDRALTGELDPDHRRLLERVWENALKSIDPRPPLQEAEAEIHEGTRLILQSPGR